MYTNYEYTRTNDIISVETFPETSLQTYPVPAGLLAAGVLDEALFFEIQQATLDGAQRELRLSDDIRRVAV